MLLSAKMDLAFDWGPLQFFLFSGFDGWWRILQGLNLLGSQTTYIPPVSVFSLLPGPLLPSLYPSVAFALVIRSIFGFLTSAHRLIKRP
jgi:hypothetical protein